jgi:hypothetical protein
MIFVFDLETDHPTDQPDLLRRGDLFETATQTFLTDSQRDQLLTQDGGEYRMPIPQKSEDFDEWIKERGQEEWYDQSAMTGHNGSNYIQWRVEQRPHWNQQQQGENNE